MKNQSTEQAVELKGSMLPVVVLHVYAIDADILYPQLHKKIDRGRAFFAGAPILIDLSEIEEEKQQKFDLCLLVTTLREMNLAPVAIRGGASCLDRQVTLLGIGMLPVTCTGKSVDLAAHERFQENADAAAGAVVKEEAEEVHAVKAERTTLDVHDSHAAEPEHRKTGETGSGQEQEVVKTMVVAKPVRSGQRIVAQGDLVLLSSVNAGAEVLAVGSIHVYGPLRGRALAGIKGDLSAKIFALQCGAELIAIGDEYMVSEDLSRKLKSPSVLISRADEGLRFTSLASFQKIR